MTATVRVLSGPGAGRVLAIDRELVVGRGGSDLEIADPDLSRRHVALRPVAGGVEIEDLGSTNGTFVDGRRIEGRVTLDRDARIVIGGSELAVEVPAPASAPVSAPVSAPGGAAAGNRELAIRAGVLGTVAVLVLLLVLAQTGDSESTRRLDATLGTTFLRQEGLGAVSAGTIRSGPTGQGSVTIDHIFRLPRRGQPFAPGVPTHFSGKIVARFADGSITSTLQATTTRQADNSLTTTGRAKVVSGTGEYDGASGTLRVTGSQAAGSPRGELRLTGSVTY